MDSEMIVTVGVDTHTDVHMAAVLDQAGRLLATASPIPSMPSLPPAPCSPDELREPRNPVMRKWR